jgi:hypothetical protein
VSQDYPFWGFKLRETKEEGEHFESAPGEVTKQSGPSIRGGHVVEIESPSVFQILGTQIDRGIVSIGVTSHAITKQRGPSI